jgi:dienelactone hydrolase
MGCELSEVISRILRLGWWWVLGWAVVCGLSAQQFPSNWAIADARLATYFEAEVRRIETNCMADVRTLGDWTGQRDERRRQLLDMLGLWPLPERTDLKPVITGRLDGDGFRVEKLQFQSMPGLYVTANLYLPKGVTGAVPAILYVCGHAEVKTNGVSLGNKTGYQHHGAWLAQHGYVCLVIDTLQLGEIQGDHHGTYRLGQWWWNARGYTPAGVEAWNSMRALDYLETRPEVDKTRFGMTGRSGGGSYTWTTAAVDERVKVAAPVAGMTDLRNHVCDGAVEGHCDCMFFVNTYRWDFRLNAALFAPRPLLIVNTDADNIFPLDGVTRLFTATRRIYEMYGAYDRIGLVIGPGPHKDSQNLQVPVLRWFNQHLRDQDPVVVGAAEKPFAPEQLRVLDVIPADQRNKTAQEFFGERLPPNVDSLETLRQLLSRAVFMGWPNTPPDPEVRLVASGGSSGRFLREYEFTSQTQVPLRVFVLGHEREVPTRVELRVLDESGWRDWLAAGRFEFGQALSRHTFSEMAASGARLPLLAPGSAVVWFCPRGVGPDRWEGDARKQVQIRRRFQLLGQTVDGMRVWDVRRALSVVRGLAPGATVAVQARGVMASHVLHAAVFEEDSLELNLEGLPETYRQGPDYLNAGRITDPTRVRGLVRSVHRVGGE